MRSPTGSTSATGNGNSLKNTLRAAGSVQNQRQEIQAIKDSIKRNSEEQRQIELGKAEGELSVVKARADSLRRQLGQVEGEIRTLDARGRELAGPET